MIYTLDNPVGADRVAQNIMSRIHDRIGWDNVDVYGIVEQNFDEGKFLLEAYVGANEYRDVLLNDDRAGSIFIIDDQSHSSKDGIRFTATFKVVFMLDLGKIFPEANYRAKQEAQLNAIKILRETSIFKFDSLERGVRASLGNFFYNDLIGYDLQPYHTFAISGDIIYSVSCLID